MTVGQLKEAIVFEAKLSDVDALGGWLNLTIGEVLDDYTSQVRYDELYVPNVTLNLVADTQTVSLPADLQHLDIDKIRYRRSAISTAFNDYILDSNRFPFGQDEGYPRFIQRGLNQLTIWPPNQIAIGDQLVIDYWKKGSWFLYNDVVTDNTLLTEGGDPLLIESSSIDTREIVPASLISTVKLAMIARASLFGDSKQFAVFRQMQKESHARSFGSTNLGTANG